jgi:hypothetical protein
MQARVATPSPAAHTAQARPAPRFFLMRGQVRPNFETPRAAALQAGLATLGLAPEVPPEAPAHRAAPGA